MRQSKDDKIKIMINYKGGKVMVEFGEPHLPRYQIGLDTSMKGRDFVFNCVHLLYHKCHEIKVVDHI